MSELNPYQQLGVTEDASFEEIQFAKENLKQQYKDDAQVLDNIEIAYDSIIMERLRLRQEGKIKVPEKIRFPEKIVEKQKSSSFSNYTSSLPTTPNWLQNLLDQPSVREVSINGIIFLVLIIASILNQSGETLPLLLTLGVGVGFFTLYRKQRLFWRSIGIIFVTFIIGIGLGSLVANLLVNLGFNLSLTTEQFVSMFTFFSLWLANNFLR